METEIKIRDIKHNERVLLDDFLYDAIFIPEGLDKPDKEIIKLPELSVYTKDFGKDTDLCLVAESRGVVTGAIWSRLFTEDEKGYGFVDANTPEICMSVKLHDRNRGIGTKLLKGMIEKLTQQGYEQVSLSVDKLNYAYRLYQKFGFETYRSDDTSPTMMKRLRK